MASIKQVVASLEASVSALVAKLVSTMDFLTEGKISAEELAALIGGATQAAVAGIMARIQGMDVSELTVRSEIQRKIVEVMSAYAPDIKFFFDLFVAPLYTVGDNIFLGGVKTVAGDDSVDVAATAQLVVGREYVVESGETSALVIVKDILSATRFRTMAPVPVSMTGGNIRRSNWTFGTNGATATAGKVYYSLPISLDGEWTMDKTVVVRFSSGASLPLVYFRDSLHEAWTEALWEWRSSPADEPGFVDVEYIVPARGSFEIKIVSTDAMTVRHIMGFTGSNGQSALKTHRPPHTPDIVFPASNAADVGDRPLVQVSGYVHDLLTPQSAIQVQVSDQSGQWAAPHLIYDSGTASPALGVHVPSGFLAVNTGYYVRARMRDSQNSWSEWSTEQHFTTAAAFPATGVASPDMTYPTNGNQGVVTKPTLRSSLFSGYGGSPTQAAAQWQVALDASFSAIVFDSASDASNLTSLALDAGHALTQGQSYYARVRHQGDFGGGNTPWSEWSVAVAFLVDEAVGICLVQAGGGAGEWHRLNSDCTRRTNLPPNYFSQHPVYSGIVDVTIDGQAMVKIPRFYGKSILAPTGSPYAGNRCWFVSPVQLAGYEPHQCFHDESLGAPDLTEIYVGKYLLSDDAGKGRSVAASSPTTGSNFATVKSLCEARNADGVTGFRVWDIYMHAAIKLLVLLEMGTPDVQASIGRGHVDGTPSGVQDVDNSVVAQATWRGIVGLWGNVWQMVDGLQKTSTGLARLWDAGRAYVTTDRSMPSGWIMDVQTGQGTGYDLSNLFLPKDVSGSEADGTFGDYCLANATRDCIAMVGGPYDYAGAAGAFSLNLNNAPEDAPANAGSRLAKY